uniref:Uncharacterized protein n=1 Tax=Plectus sambesii TaxID=2011161 RepID=A0A914XML7_9BILA
MRLVTGQSTILQNEQLYTRCNLQMVGERTLHLPIGRRKASKSFSGDDAVSPPSTAAAAAGAATVGAAVGTAVGEDQKSTTPARGGFFSSGLRSPGAVLRRSTYPHKKPLGPSLSWDPSPKRRTRSTSTSPRLRIHSDGTEDVLDNGEPPGLELEHSCLHCSLASELKKRQLKNEIESAVKRLARRLGTGSKPSSWPRVHSDSLDPLKRAQLGTPDIVVSSVSSDEDTDPGMGRQTSSDVGSMPTSGASTPTSSTSASPRPPNACNGETRGGFFVGDRMSMENSRECLSPVVVVDSGERGEEAATAAGGQSERAATKAMDCLMPPGPVGLSLNPDSNSPPRSNSVDLSTLRRDIELLSISSGDSEYGSDIEFDAGSSMENLKTCRSKSHDPAPSPDLLLRRPSRIEHLSELFR